MKINSNYKNIAESYLFSTVAQKVREHQAAHPDKKILRLGIGDVTLPLCPAVVTALEEAVAEMGESAGFRGYGPEQGYDFLREAVAGYYARRQVSLDPNEIFISDGAKSDIGNFTDLFDADNTVLIPSPVYPVYMDTNIMNGRRLVLRNGTEENGFAPMPDPAQKVDIIYLCSPNNPTGAVYTHAQLKAWVDYANAQEAVILFDAAYEAFVGDDSLPRSIYEVPGARTCAVEFNSFSKTAGFTGTRCGYTVVPFDLVRGGLRLRDMWLRRQTTKFNGVPYIVQRAAAAVFTPQGQAQTREAIDYYMANGSLIAQTLRKRKVWFVGGENSPYIWLRCGMPSWEYFDRLLEEGGIVGTPGAGFGEAGEGYFRLTVFGNRETVEEAMARMENLPF